MMQQLKDWFGSKRDSVRVWVGDTKDNLVLRREAMLDAVWEVLVRWPFRAVAIALAVGFLAGALSVGGTVGLTRTSYAVPGVPPFAAFTESLPQSAVHLYVGHDGTCSASTIAPGLMLTAAHCWDSNGLGKIIAKDGRALQITGGERSRNSDTALLYVRDMYCPCVPVHKADVKPGTEVMVIGYPQGTYVPDSRGVATEYATAWHVLESLYGPRPEGMTDDDAPVYYPSAVYLLHTAPLIPGHSGGPTLAKIGGEWKVIGVNSWAARSFVFLLSGSVPISQSDLFTK